MSRGFPATIEDIHQSRGFPATFEDIHQSRGFPATFEELHQSSCPTFVDPLKGFASTVENHKQSKGRIEDRHL